MIPIVAVAGAEHAPYIIKLYANFVAEVATLFRNATIAFISHFQAIATHPMSLDSPLVLITPLQMHKLVT